MFYKYADITSLKRDVTAHDKLLTALGLVDLAANVKMMKESIIFTPEFQSRLSTVCSEHDRMREKIEENSKDVTIVQEQLKHVGEKNYGININKGHGGE